MISEDRGLVGSARRLISNTRLEGPARALVGWVRRLVHGPGADSRVGPLPAPTVDEPPIFVAPGHFYSPLPSTADIEAYRERFRAGPPQTIPAIDLRLEEQVALLSDFKPFYDEQPFPIERGAETRYWFENGSFGSGDALALYCMLRRLRPRAVVEVGSGWSSCVLLDTCERFLDWEPRLTMIEPYPNLLRELIRPGDLARVRLREEPVQQVPLAEFEALESGDVLFIDSTHVTRVGSDVNYEIFEVLPALQPGVYVHFHDIFYPFEYPLAWVEEGRGWNETYVLRAFLEYNNAFEITLFNDLVHQRLFDHLTLEFPLWMRNPGGSLWLRKRG